MLRHTMNNIEGGFMQVKEFEMTTIFQNMKTNGSTKKSPTPKTGIIFKIGSSFVVSVHGQRKIRRMKGGFFHFSIGYAFGAFCQRLKMLPSVSLK
jgi:hypothetical protein